MSFSYEPDHRRAKLLVIGGTSGIGEETANMIKGLHDWDVFTPEKDELDVRSIGSVVAYLANHGSFDYVVYAAGVNYLEWLGKGYMPAHEDLIDVNLTGFIRFMDLIVAYQEDRTASVVVVGSDSAERPLRTSISYCASKAGLHQAARVAARELGPKGWRVNVVAPGMTDETGMQEYVDARVQEVRGWDEEFMRQYETSQEVVPGRISKAEVAEAIYFTLIGPAHLNGSIITINGGR